ncbi:unnamed protein product [Dibothriocephalus latus]|uniref:Uncharacterized protein n=1 Tax=Dibothriocephalus latus TaxID=60516 RepID=A0A3P6QDL0_DIBLA|nr:unnamed protein product [Dibothriocephalus latus]
MNLTFFTFFKAISLILRLAKQKSQKRMEIETLQNKVKALQILNSNYERIAVANSYAFDSSNSVVTEPTKIQLFQLFMESLFQSFDSAVSASEMDQLSRQIITWMEISCKPEVIFNVVSTVSWRLTYFSFYVLLLM